MRRRKFIGATAAGIVTAASGCLGYTLESEDDVEAREERIAELEETVQEQQETIDAQESTLAERRSRIEELDAEITRKEERIATLESRNENREERTADLESRVETLQREKVSELYGIAYEHYESGNNAFDQAESTESNGTQDTATALFSAANHDYLAAQRALSRSREVAEQLGASSTVLDTLSSSRSTLDHYATAALNYANENLFRTRGNTQTADQYESDGATAYSKAQRGTVATVEQVDSALGL